MHISVLCSAHAFRVVLKTILSLVRQDAYLHSATGRGAAEAFQNHWELLSARLGSSEP